jgi:hypothetical protein
MTARIADKAMAIARIGKSPFKRSLDDPSLRTKSDGKMAIHVRAFKTGRICDGSPQPGGMQSNVGRIS